MDILPSWMGRRTAGEYEHYDAAFGNDALRVGEVTAVVYPEDERSRTHKFIEYDVLVQHRENQSAVTMRYENCLFRNAAAGLADRSKRTLRVGSMVLLLCINKASAEPVILSGIRDDRDSDLGEKTLGHNLLEVFNGVQFRVNKDGSWDITYGGATKEDGTPADGVDAKAVGTKISVSANGNFEISTQSGQKALIDHAAGTIALQGQEKLTADAKRINIGTDADQHAVLGDELIDIMKATFKAIRNITVVNSGGTTSPPLNLAEFQAVEARFERMLSHQTFLKRG